MSQRSPTLHVPVLIAGAGAGGLAAAIELARRGFAPLVVDRRPAPPDHPRATGISTWTMERLRAWGLQEAVLAHDMDVEWRIWRGDTLAEEGEAIDVGLPTREQSAALSPVHPACVAQDELEPLLVRRAVALGATVARGVEVVGVRPGRDGVDVVLRSAGGRTRTVRAGHLIGADGAHSTVREALGIGMRGPGAVADAVGAVFHAPVWDLVGDRRHGVYAITHPEAAGVLVPAGRGDRWVYGRTGDARRLARASTPAGLTRLIRLATGAPGLEPRIARVTGFAYTALLAERFRDGRVLLAGDAAHRVTPRGGTGMNAAIRDGYDLGWKLAWVLRGWAGPALLDTYEAERRPVVQHDVERSARPDGSTSAATDALHVDLGGRIAHLWLPAGDGRRSTLDLLGPGLTRFCGPDAPEGADGVPGGPPVTRRQLPAITARALGIGPGGSLLVRPDGVPVRDAVAHAALAA